MNPADREEVKRITPSDKEWIIRTIHRYVTIAILVSLVMLVWVIGHDIGELRSRITALETQVKEGK